MLSPCNRRLALAAALAGALLAPVHTGGLRLEPSGELLSAEVIAAGLKYPAGLAADPRSDLLFVAESGANRISVIRKKTFEPVLSDQFTVSRDLPAWAYTAQRDEAFWLRAALRKPVGLAFDNDGRLFVAEADKGGRLLCFEPLRDGLQLAHAIPTPWLDTSYGFTSVAVDSTGRVFVTTREADPKAVLVFGSIAVRESNGNWWLVDHGPFADFSNVAITRNGGTLVVGEHRSADVSWYDVDRQIELGTMPRIDGVRHVAVLPDGTTLASLSREDGTWSVAEIDPLNHNVAEWVGQLGEIGGLYVHPESGDVFVSLAREGKILRLRRLGENTWRDEEKMRQLTKAFALEKALPPKEWPEFFRKFIQTLDVIQAVNQPVVNQVPTPGGSPVMCMTMTEFASAVPVVAAKVKARLLSPPEIEPDPIEEISFVLFYPNQSVVTHKTAAPSVSLFRVKHKSGRVARTRFMPNKSGRALTEDMDWDEMPEVLVSFPSGYLAAESGLTEEGLIRVYFLGMGLGPDYWINLHRLQEDKNHMLVEKLGGRKVEYALEPFTEGGEKNPTVLVAGLKIFDKGWLNLGPYPVTWSLVSNEDKPLKFKHGVKLAELTPDKIRTEPLLAQSYERELTKDEISIYRRLILRAATRWSKQGL